jgi:hypothetical protein
MGGAVRGDTVKSAQRFRTVAPETKLLKTLVTSSSLPKYSNIQLHKTTVTAGR